MIDSSLDSQISSKSNILKRSRKGIPENKHPFEANFHFIATHETFPRQENSHAPPLTIQAYLHYRIHTRDESAPLHTLSPRWTCWCVREMYGTQRTTLSYELSTPLRAQGTGWQGRVHVLSDARTVIGSMFNIQYPCALPADFWKGPREPKHVDQL